MTSKLTSRNFWEKYWESKNIVNVVPENFAFHRLFQQELEDKDYRSMIEIGGFPGLYAVYFRKYWKYDSTLLDYVIDKKVINQILSINKLKSNDVSVLKKDFFRFESNKKYDLVYSLGFIEHFDDVKDVIERHWELVGDKGKMIIGIPNFLGINGIYQLIFDPKNLNIHNLEAMDKDNLTKIIKNLGIKKYKIIYVSGALLWLENIQNRPWLLRTVTYVFNVIGLVLTKLGLKGKAISTHIFIIAEK